MLCYLFVLGAVRQSLPAFVWTRNRVSLHYLQFATRVTSAQVIDGMDVVKKIESSG
jgi:hypothetical protein